MNALRFLAFLRSGDVAVTIDRGAKYIESQEQAQHENAIQGPTTSLLHPTRAAMSPTTALRQSSGDVVLFHLCDCIKLEKGSSLDRVHLPCTMTCSSCSLGVAINLSDSHSAGQPFLPQD